MEARISGPHAVPSLNVKIFMVHNQPVSMVGIALYGILKHINLI